MDEPIYAEDIKACPKCGSTEFWENWVIEVGDDPTDAVLANVDCINCGASFYGRDYYQRHFGKSTDEEIPF